jgi:hypothetical protein
MDSIKRYVAFFPIVSLPTPPHHPFLTAVNNIYSDNQKEQHISLEFFA